MQDKIKKKIAALMNMTVENGATVHEALVAATKAQELIAKFHITTLDSASEKETVGEDNLQGSRKWIQLLAGIVCENMSCRLILFSLNRKTMMKFIGRDSDRTAAIKTFLMLSSVCQRGIAKEKKRVKSHGSSAGIEIAYSTGFLKAVAEEMSKQSKALILLVPSSVDDYIQTTYPCTRVVKSKISYRYRNKNDIEIAKANGYHDGKNVVGQKKLVSKNV